MERNNPLIETTVSNASPASMEEQQLQSLSREELQRAIQNYNAQRQVSFWTQPSTKQKLTCNPKAFRRRTNNKTASWSL
jgi:hypothetical protein